MPYLPCSAALVQQNCLIALTVAHLKEFWQGMILSSDQYILYFCQLFRRLWLGVQGSQVSWLVEVGQLTDAFDSGMSILEHVLKASIPTHRYVINRYAD